MESEAGRVIITLWLWTGEIMLSLMLLYVEIKEPRSTGKLRRYTGDVAACMTARDQEMYVTSACQSLGCAFEFTYVSYTCAELHRNFPTTGRLRVTNGSQEAAKSMSINFLHDVTTCNFCVKAVHPIIYI